MLATLPRTVQSFMTWEWLQIEPYFQELEARPLTEDNVEQWLADWTHLSELIAETYERLYVTITVNTEDKEAEKRYRDFLDNILPVSESAAQKLKTKFLASELDVPGFEIPRLKMQTEAELFREENLPLMTEDRKLALEYDKVVGAQMVEWEGKEITVTQLNPVFQNPDRVVRERAWRLAHQRWLADRQAINDLWGKFLDVRRKIASNAGYQDYRTYRWREMQRYDYTPEDCMTFHEAIEEVAVPVAVRIYERRRERLGVQALRPWDLKVDPLDRPALQPFETMQELESKSAAIFQGVDPQLGRYFQTMRDESLLDLANRKGKAPGGYCIAFSLMRRPFIFMNSVGIHTDVRTMLHEAGHCFHVFESSHLPYFQQLNVNTEFAEVASMAMELVAAPYLSAAQGGFYSDADAARARIEHLEDIILFWPYMAVVDAFQHWVYTHHEDAADPDQCDAQWSALWDRFMKGVDWSGLEAEKVTGWHRKLHIHEIPFYYVEYGLAQMGAVQVWRNSLKDQAGAVAQYRKALALGGTVSLPELYAAAGAKFAFDAPTLRQCVELVERTIGELEAEGR